MYVDASVFPGWFDNRQCLDDRIAQSDQHSSQFLLCCALTIAKCGHGAAEDAHLTRTRAHLTPEGWKIQGQKLWCSGAAAENVVIAMLVRTDLEAKKHSGLSVLLVPNSTPKVDIRKLPTMARRATGTTEIFLDGAVVPPGNPKEIVSRLTSEVLTTLKDPDLQRKILAAGSTSRPEGAEGLQAAQLAEISKMKEASSAIGLVAE